MLEARARGLSARRDAEDEGERIRAAAALRRRAVPRQPDRRRSSTPTAGTTPADFDRPETHPAASDPGADVERSPRRACAVSRRTRRASRPWPRRVHGPRRRARGASWAPSPAGQLPAGARGRGLRARRGRDERCGAEPPRVSRAEGGGARGREPDRPSTSAGRRASRRAAPRRSRTRASASSSRT